MGKYNFSAMKFEEIIKRLEALEEANNELRKENAALRNKKVLTPDRVVLDNIRNADMAKELFGYKNDRGKLVKDENSVRNNFQVFYQNVFRALNPMARDYERKSIVYTPISTLTDSEYQIYVETLEEVLDIVYYAHKKLKGLQEGK